MQKNKTVMINGREYDAVTGLAVVLEPVSVSIPAASVPPTAKPNVSRDGTTVTHAGAVHAKTQRSQTLQRRMVHKPAAAQKQLVKRRSGQSMDIAKSAHISRFAAHPKPATVTTVDKTPIADKPATSHPIAKRANEALAVKAAPLVLNHPISSKEIKEAAIDKALKAKTSRTFNKTNRQINKRVTIIGSALLILIVAGYVAYTSLPHLSVNFAASQAGIAATYPDYRPDGYRLGGPINFSDGKVSMNFVSNGNQASYTLTETRSSWNSTAVLDNVVKKKAANDYITTQERGLTIYSYNGDGAWVNGGILYTIDGDAPLTGEQIRHIATSL